MPATRQTPEQYAETQATAVIETIERALVDPTPYALRDAVTDALAAAFATAYETGYEEGFDEGAPAEDGDAA